MKKVILFDLDSTLTDRKLSIIKYAYSFYKQFCDQLKKNDLNLVKKVLLKADGDGHRNKSEVFSEIQKNLTWQIVPSLDELTENWELHFPNATIARKGVMETIKQFHVNEFKLGIITNGSSFGQRQKIKTLGLQKYFEYIIISEEVGYRKPQLEIFNIALKQAKAEANDVIYVGDHPVYDIDGSIQAGLKSIWLSIRKWPSYLPAPRYKFSEFKNLIDIVNSINISEE